MSEEHLRRMNVPLWYHRGSIVLPRGGPKYAGRECVSRAGIVRGAHEFDADDKCVFCDLLRPE